MIDVPEEVILANHFTLKELSEILHIDIERAKGKMLEADPNLKRSMIISQDIESTFVPCCYMMKREGKHCSNDSGYVLYTNSQCF